VESTAEGAEGAFFDLCIRAQALADEGRFPNKTEWMFHFFPWWQDPNYVLDEEATVHITAADHAYFADVETKMGCHLSMDQRRWYVAKRENDFAGDPEKMWQEMPSTEEECWQKSTQGTFYGRQMSVARKEGRIGRVPHIQGIPVNTFWDIGNSDGTGIWLHQYVGAEDRFIRYIEGWGEAYEHYVKELNATGYVFGLMYLPHDAAHARQGAKANLTPMAMLQGLAPHWRFRIVPQVQDLQQGIEATRAAFPRARFDAEGCKEGLQHVGLYKKKWNHRAGAWSNEPEKLDGHSEAADGLRQWAQGFNPAHLTLLNPTHPARAPRRATGMTA
jgi:hypothetical protein